MNLNQRQKQVSKQQSESPNISLFSSPWVNTNYIIKLLYWSIKMKISTWIFHNPSHSFSSWEPFTFYRAPGNSHFKTRVHSFCLNKKSVIWCFSEEIYFEAIIEFFYRFTAPDKFQMKLKFHSGRPQFLSSTRLVFVYFTTLFSVSVAKIFPSVSCLLWHWIKGRTKEKKINWYFFWAPAPTQFISFCLRLEIVWVLVFLLTAEQTMLETGFKTMGWCF